MKTNPLPAGFALWLLATSAAPAAVRYVDVNSANPTPPYTDWATAATNIQDAVDAALAGDQILVTNGVYRHGGTSSSRVGIDKHLTIQSVNGPQFTFIDGGGTGRCVSGSILLGPRSIFLSGLTLTNGGFPMGTIQGGGAAIFCTLSNCTLINNRSSAVGGGAAYCNLSTCVLTNNSAASLGGGAYSTFANTLDRCTLAGNVANIGGGAYGGALTNCTLIGNWALAPGNVLKPVGGGGASSATLDHCTLENNWALGQGGGANACQLSNCKLLGNRAGDYFTLANGAGGGAYDSTLNYCTLITNSASFGGGAAYGQLYNCLVIANSAAHLGGGVYDANEIKSCTIVGNSASEWGGGGGVRSTFVRGRLYNCIVYYNNDSSDWGNYSGDVELYHCCTTPINNTTNWNIVYPPRFVDTNGWSNLHLDPSSRLINAGNYTYAPGPTDLDGRPRIGQVDIGAFEFVEAFNDWLQQYGLATDGSADFIDSDNDGLNNYQEWVTHTDPNSSPVLQMLSPITDSSGVVLRWQSVSDRYYFLERSTNLAVGSFSSVASNILGQAGTTSFTDTNAIGPGPFFYRVGVQR